MLDIPSLDTALATGRDWDNCVKGILLKEKVRWTILKGV